MNKGYRFGKEVSLDFCYRYRSLNLASVRADGNRNLPTSPKRLSSTPRISHAVSLPLSRLTSWELRIVVLLQMLGPYILKYNFLYPSICSYEKK